MYIYSGMQMTKGTAYGDPIKTSLRRGQYEVNE
jgi:hypothetical protein